MGVRCAGSRIRARLHEDNPCLRQADRRSAIEAPELKVEEGRKADPEKIRDHQEARQGPVGPKGQESTANCQPQRGQVNQSPAGAPVPP
jgi:hypothetical protein